MAKIMQMHSERPESASATSQRSRKAVWDGKRARGCGGTAGVVAEARQRGIPVAVIWPDGARRDHAA